MEADNAEVVAEEVVNSGFATSSDRAVVFAVPRRVVSALVPLLAVAVAVTEGKDAPWVGVVDMDARILPRVVPMGFVVIVGPPELVKSIVLVGAEDGAVPVDSTVFGAGSLP